MRDVFQYFDLLAKAVEFSFAESAELDFDRRDFSRGLIDGVVYFADGSRLEFTEKVILEGPEFVKQSYRYQYVRAGKTTFRYDNSEHHRKLSNFPHHKHVGRKIISAIEPTLAQVLDEVREILKETSMERSEPRVRLIRRHFFQSASLSFTKSAD